MDLKHQLEDARVTLKLLEGRDGCQPGPSVELAPAQLPSLVLCGVVASRPLEKEFFPLLVERCGLGLGISVKEVRVRVGVRYKCKRSDRL